MLRRNKDETPSVEKQAALGVQSEIQAHEAMADIDYGKLAQLREFGAMLLEDGNFQTYFTPKVYIEDAKGETKILDNPLYSHAYEPLRLYFSRLLRIGFMDKREQDQFQYDVHNAAQNCYRLTKVREEHFIIESMEKWLSHVVCSQSAGGFFLKTMLEQQKTLRLLNPALEKKKGWFNF